MKHWGLRDYSLIFLFSLGIAYGVMSLRYLFTLFLSSSEMPKYWIFDFHYYYFPWINKITFLMHAGIGCVVLLLAPLVFLGFTRNWKSRDKLIKAYFFFSIFPTLFPLVFILQSQGKTSAYFIIFSIEFLWLFCLYKSIRYYLKNNITLCFTYLFYHFTVSLGAAIWRLVGFATNFLIFDHNNIGQEQFSRELIDLHEIYKQTGGLYDIDWYLALAIGIALAKYITNFNPTHLESSEAHFVLNQTLEEEEEEKNG